MVEEGGLTFTFADAPEKIEAEKPAPPVKSKTQHSPPPLRALKSAPENAPAPPRKRRSRVGDDDEFKEAVDHQAAVPHLTTSTKLTPSAKNRATSNVDEQGMIGYYEVIILGDLIFGCERSFHLLNFFSLPPPPPFSPLLQLIALLHPFKLQERVKSREHLIMVYVTLSSTLSTFQNQLA